MRKTPQRLLLAATLVTVLNFQSCGKYEDGPAFTLKTKKSRLVRDWEVVKLSDASGNTIIPSTGAGYTFEIEFEFDKDGDFKQQLSYSYSYDGYTYSDTYTEKGEWEFSKDKEDLEMDFDFGGTQDWKIMRLTKDEFNFEDEDGNEWELEAK